LAKKKMTAKNGSNIMNIYDNWWSNYYEYVSIIDKVTL
jgi:hypothetical protein